jgi:hypothetical protein
MAYPTAAIWPAVNCGSIHELAAIVLTPRSAEGCKEMSGQRDLGLGSSVLLLARLQALKSLSDLYGLQDPAKSVAEPDASASANPRHKHVAGYRPNLRDLRPVVEIRRLHSLTSLPADQPFGVNE